MRAWETRSAIQPANQDGRSRCRVAELRPESRSDAMGGTAFLRGLEGKTPDGADIRSGTLTGKGSQVDVELPS